MTGLYVNELGVKVCVLKSCVFVCDKVVGDNVVFCWKEL